MNSIELVEAIKEILPAGGSYDHSVLKIYKIDDGIELSYGKMYEPPELNFTTLKKLSELFGTDNVDVDNYSQGGCESCDWGSNYGHTIQIREITQNLIPALELCNGEIYNER